jgi:predicted GNAT family acetyltransferase
MKIVFGEGRIWAKTEHGEAELDYRIKDNYMIIYHTGTPEEDRGKGIAEELTDKAFEFAIRSGLKIIPACPYTQYYIKKKKITEY